MSTDRRDAARVRWIVGAICALALGLRVYGVAFGLPDLHHPDESPILNRALSFAKGSLKPQNFLYPTLYLYLLFAWEVLFFIVGRVIGLFDSIAAFQRDFFLDPTRVVVAARWLTAVFGTLTVAAVYRFGAKLYDRMTGVCAALFLAVAPLAVRDAHYIKMDVPVSLFVVLTLSVLAGVVTSDAPPRPRTWMAAGLFAGLAISTQYYAAVVVVPIVLVAIDAAWRSGQWRGAASALAWSGLATIVGFVAGSPFFLFNLAQVRVDFAELRKVDMDRAVSSGAFSSIGPYLEILWRDTVGRIVVALAGVVFAHMAFTDRRRAFLMLGFFLPFLAFVANSFPVSRYLNPILPVLCVAAAVPIAALARAGKSDLPIARGVVVAALIAMEPLWASVALDRFLQQPDTRTLAREFIERTIPDGSSILIQPHSVQLRQSRDALVEALRAHLGNESFASTKFQSQLSLDPYPSPAYRTIFLGDEAGLDVDKIYVLTSAFNGGSLEALRGLRVTYVVLTQYNAPHPAFSALETALNRDGHVIATFTPYRADVSAEHRAEVAPFFHNTADRIDPALERPGPMIAIWKIDR